MSMTIYYIKPVIIPQWQIEEASFPSDRFETWRASLHSMHYSSKRLSIKI